MFLTKEERRRLRWHKFLESLATVAAGMALAVIFATMIIVFN